MTAARECKCPMGVERCAHFGGQVVSMATWESHRKNGHNCSRVLHINGWWVREWQESLGIPINCSQCGMFNAFLGAFSIHSVLFLSEDEALTDFDTKVEKMLGEDEVINEVVIT